MGATRRKRDNSAYSMLGSLISCEIMRNGMEPEGCGRSVVTMAEVWGCHYRQLEGITETRHRAQGNKGVRRARKAIPGRVRRTFRLNVVLLMAATPLSPRYIWVPPALGRRWFTATPPPLRPCLGLSPRTRSMLTIIRMCKMPIVLTADGITTQPPPLR